MSKIFRIKINEQKELESVYAQSLDKLNNFFDIRWEQNKPKVYIVSDRETAESLRGKQTPDWIVGWNGDGGAFVLDKDIFLNTKNTNRDNDDYKMLIMHELAHLYFKIVTGGKTQPNWLWEGTSILASGQAEKWNKPAEFRSFLDNKDVYSEAGHALLLLTRQFGKEKFIQMLKNYKTYDGDFSGLFKNTYDMELTYATFEGLIKHQ
ncbi:hypothetical protein A2380_00650 [candidate division WWE3 bacterium RIFOXYB1_FULL_43_24]|nr:MAG: hypothetical protein A2212_01040 [candidate division WWE3 bacterium RIFOXYA1_FULL_42_9]OGC69453.1 MAG: hypothetical protein A2380_00650 [candidate division WWE3 bacterium RIFOXYB1_FULL_43_24]OGC72300.1 MAG: hypothetical protein A2414_03520 [candidate division WWE3 bacterium RIFOXYC1_FULL_42_13]